MTNEDSRHEERVRNQEEFAAMSTELAELIAEGREDLEKWEQKLAERQQELEERQQASGQRVPEVERRHDASRTLLQRLLEKARDIDARVVQLES